MSTPENYIHLLKLRQKEILRLRKERNIARNELNKVQGVVCGLLQ